MRDQTRQREEHGYRTVDITYQDLPSATTYLKVVRGGEGDEPYEKSKASPEPLDDSLLAHKVPALDAHDLVDVFDQSEVRPFDRALLNLCRPQKTSKGSVECSAAR